MTIHALFINLDGALTRQVEKNLRRNALHQNSKLTDIDNLLSSDGYYLSDDGYSRVIATEGDDNPEDCKLYLSGVSRPAVVARWNDPDVVILRREIEAILREAVLEHL